MAGTKILLRPRWLLPALLAAGCGDSTEVAESALDPSSQCGPFGQWHLDHCDCDPGYSIWDGVCALDPDPTPSTDPDCGPNGNFSGQFCECASGHTQTGAGSGRTCTAIPACSGNDDRFEPNDRSQDAATMPSENDSLYACPANPDWFVFQVTPGDRVSVEIRFDGESVDLDLFAFGPSSRDPIDWSLSERGNVEIASYVARAEGTGAVMVLPYGIGEGEYQMTLQIEEGSGVACGQFGQSCRSPGDCCTNICHVGHCH